MKWTTEKPKECGLYGVKVGKQVVEHALIWDSYFYGPDPVRMIHIYGSNMTMELRTFYNNYNANILWYGPIYIPEPEEAE